MRILFDQITGAVESLVMIEALNFSDCIEQCLFVTIAGRRSRKQTAVQAKCQQKDENPVHRTDNTRSSVIFHSEPIRLKPSRFFTRSL